MGNCKSKKIDDLENIEYLSKLLMRNHYNISLEIQELYIKIRKDKKIYMVDYNILNHLYEVYVFDRNNIIYSHKSIKNIYNWMKKNIL